MTLDEAIKECEEMTELWKTEGADTFKAEYAQECSEKNRQLAEWLKELRELRAEKVKVVARINLDPEKVAERVMEKLREEYDLQHPAGVFIPGMEKPKSCDECCIRQINLARCQLTGRSTSHYPSGKEIKGIPNFCPLVDTRVKEGEA